MIALENVSTELLDSASFEVGEGRSAALIAASDSAREMLLELMVGLRRPRGGRVLLMGEDIYSLPGRELFTIMRETGIVWRDGGLLSNLKVWENILLPARYHRGARPEDVEPAVRDILERLGAGGGDLEGFMASLPALIPEGERPLAGFARAVLMEPGLMIYDAVFESLDPEASERFAALAREFHRQLPARTSVYVGTDEHFLRYVEPEVVIRQEGRGFQPWH
jgi:phospholipid/cholesterol/gamma-HCH transport system ATP-binding protein